MAVSEADVAAVGVATPGEGWAVRDLRKVAAAATAGLVVGFVVNGIGSRLAMMLLARLNPDATGRLSDDGFTMGRFNLDATLGLILFTTGAGVVGGLIYLAVRELRAGPRWFQTLALTAGPGVVIGAMLVRTDGVDFTILEPVALAIALFVALPALFAFAVSRVADRWLRPDSWFLTGSRRRLAALAALVPAIPALPIVGVGVVARVVYRLWPALQTARTVHTFRWIGRFGLAALFALALVDLVNDVRVLL